MKRPKRTFSIDEKECSGLMKPDIYLGDNVRHKEVLYDKQTTYFYSRIQTRSR